MAIGDSLTFWVASYARLSGYQIEASSGSLAGAWLPGGDLMPSTFEGGDVVSILLGSNDIRRAAVFSGEPRRDGLLDSYEANMEAIALHVGQFFDHVVLGKIPKWTTDPQNLFLSREYGDRLQLVCDRHDNLSCVDFWPVLSMPDHFLDGLHPNAEGQQLMAEALQSHVTGLVPEPSSVVLLGLVLVAAALFLRGRRSRVGSNGGRLDRARSFWRPLTGFGSISIGRFVRRAIGR